MKRRRCRGLHFSPIWTGLNLHEDPIPFPSLTDATLWFQSWVAVFLLPSLGKNLLILLTVFFFFSAYTDFRKTTLATYRYKHIQDHEKLSKIDLGMGCIESWLYCLRWKLIFFWGGNNKISQKHVIKQATWRGHGLLSDAKEKQWSRDLEIASLHAREQNLPFSLSRKDSMGQLWVCVSSYMQKDRNIAFLWACYTAMWCSRSSIEHTHVGVTWARLDRKKVIFYNIIQDLEGKWASVSQTAS